MHFSLDSLLTFLAGFVFLYLVLSFAIRRVKEKR